MHHIYTTEAIVIKSAQNGEANRLYFLLTEDLGLVRAVAQGVRLTKSKLKGHLLSFSLVKISLVRGREIWRITNAESIAQNGITRNQEELFVFENLSVFLLRFIHGEEKNENVFESVKSAYLFCRNSDLSSTDLKSVEVLTVLRVMHFLGYIKMIDGLSSFAGSIDLTPQILIDFHPNRKKAIFEINNAFKETHL